MEEAGTLTTEGLLAFKENYKSAIFSSCLIFVSLLQMMQKVVASEIFKDQKDGYPQSVGRLFLDSRLGTC